MDVLLTGFEPFDGELTNPSWDAVCGFSQAQIGPARVHVLQLPVVFSQASQRLLARLRTLRPSLCLCLGQAGGRAMISLEQVAVNFSHARIADNQGQRPQFCAIDPNGPAAYFAPWDLPRALASLERQGIAAELSLSAGSFVCNELFYQLCAYQQREQPSLQGSFVHIPYAPEQVLQRPGLPSLEIAQVHKALVCLIEEFSHAVPAYAKH